jgi:DNA-binding CsgD family transcriptional regulator
MRFLMPACLCDLQAWQDLAVPLLERMRAQGELTRLPYVLDHVGLLEVHRGRLDRAESHLAEARDVQSAIGAAWMISLTELAVHVHRGREAQTRESATSLCDQSAARGQDLTVSFVQAQVCILELSLGQYGQALAAARQVFAVDPPVVGIRALPDLIEAGCRSGDPEVAAAALARLEPRARASGTPWALGLLARARALLADDDAAEDLYAEAVAELEGAGAAVDLARARLVYGEWLRRHRRRRDARDQLRTAYGMFDGMGAAAFAERARAELLATGEHARQRSADPGEELTAQEDRIARLAAEGAANQEIAAQLFISPATVDYHLRKVFRKLGISRRAQLARRLPGDPAR